MFGSGAGVSVQRRRNLDELELGMEEKRKICLLVFNFIVVTKRK